MRTVLFASLLVAGMIGLASAPARAFPATPLPASAGQVDSGSVVQVHGFHCQPAWAPGWGWHRHWRACRRGPGYRFNDNRGPRFFCWHNQWSRRICRRRW